MQPSNKDNNPGSPVMDIQRPSQPTVIKPAGPLGRPATREYTRPRSDNPIGDPFSFSDQPQNMSSTPQPVVSKPKRSKLPLIILVLVLLTAAGGGAYYYFMIMKKDTAPVANTQPQPTAPAEDTNKIDASPDSIDKVTNEIDENLNSINDTEDFKPDDVSDDALGL